jgi:hypothetical protein
MCSLVWSSLRQPRTRRATHPVLVNELPKVYQFAQTTNHLYEKVGHHDGSQGGHRYLNRQEGSSLAQGWPVWSCGGGWKAGWIIWEKIT